MSQAASGPVTVHLVASDPDALVAWCEQNLAGKVSGVTAIQRPEDGPASYDVAVIVADDKSAVLVKLFWASS